MFLHDEYSFVAHDVKVAKTWTETVNTVRALGIWLVGLNQSQGMSEWGSDHARSAFASQVIAFRTNSKSSSDLVPGLLFDPNELPLAADVDGEITDRPEPGMAVHAHRAAPVRWDWLPSDADAAELARTGQAAPPETTSTAFDRFFAQPALHPLDEAAVTAVLGPPVGGRWQVGGLGGTHTLGDDDSVAGGAAGGAAVVVAAGRGARRAPWGSRASADGESAAAVEPAASAVVLSPVQAEVLALVAGGTATTGALVDAVTASKAAVHDALDALIGYGRIIRVVRGRYQVVDHSRREENPASGDCRLNDGDVDLEGSVDDARRV